MGDYFTKEEVQEVKEAMKNISGVGIVVDSKSADDEQMDTFFDKAKLWRVVREIISVLYIKRLAAKEMFLHDENDDEYWVIKKRQPRESKELEDAA
jgi:hypothetical protein